MRGLVEIRTAIQLRQHLDDLNEDGITPVVVGWDQHQAFLITLIGCYADSEAVFFDSPWQTDTDYGERVDGVWVPMKPHCDECNGMEFGIGDLAYPVTVMTK